MRRLLPCACLLVLGVACSGTETPTPSVTGGAGAGGAPIATAGTGPSASGSATAGASGSGSVGGVGAAGGGAGGLSSVGGGGAAGAAVGGAAASGAGGVGGGAATCITSGKELCDDFESGQIDAARWKLTKNGTVSITVDSEHVHSGTHAVHLKLEAGKQSTAMLTEAATFPAANNSFYARAFMYFTPDLPTAPGGDFHMGFILGLGKNDAGDVQAGTGMIGGEKQYLGYSIFFGPPKYEFGPWSKAKVEPNKWQCIELFEDGSSPEEEKRQVWLDGTELTDLRSTSNGQGAPSNHKPPPWSGAAFGVWEYHPSPLLSDIWLDDLRVSATPIGCN